VGERDQTSIRATVDKTLVEPTKFEVLNVAVRSTGRVGQILCLLQLFVEVDKLIGLFKLKILIEHLGTSGQINIAREKQEFKESFLRLPFVVYNVLPEATLCQRNDHSLSRRFFLIVG
jgi:hypothetical protein